MSTSSFPQQALLSVFNKTGIIEFSQTLVKCGITLISTGGTAKSLSDANIPVTSVSDLTKFPELLEGRVKTLHPVIHAALLAKLDSEKHVKDLQEHHISPIQLVAVNLYAFEETISKSETTLDQALEMIDIGGVALIRASAKNFAHVLIVVDPNDYTWIAERISKGGFKEISLEERKNLALKAFQHVCAYDAIISKYLATIQIDKSVPLKTPSMVLTPYEHQFDLKYGVNPHQVPASIYKIKGKELPFKVLNGTPGYINFMDALNAWQLVKELKIATGLPSAASFKHVSPAGAAVAVPLTEEEKSVYEVGDRLLTPQAIAYFRARNADPMCSFGDFAALSDVVDEATANILKVEVSDGIIAPGFDEKALEILKQKKGGKYIVIQANPNYQAPEMEYREIYGVVLAQKRNHEQIVKDHIVRKIVTTEQNLSEDAIRDLLVATITLKYTQSNSVGYAIRGQMIGVGAGQQSRVDCAKLAGLKLRNWYLRFHPKVRGLHFKHGTKKVDRTNARVHFIDDNLNKEELDMFEKVPEPLTAQEKEDWIKQLSGVSLSSDAFFPFRDSIDVASKLGVSYVAQPGGSVQDEGVIQACNEYKMTMSFTDVRLFHH